MAKREDIVKQAKSWVGLKEKDGSYKVVIDTYNSIKPLPRDHKMPYGVAWCAAFVGAVAQKCNATKIIPCDTSCNLMIDKAKTMKIWQENDAYKPQPADIIMYDWDDNGKGDDTGRAEHVGIVEKVSVSKITVIEGNKNDAVGRRTIEVNGKYIRGYILPKYETEPKAEPEKKEEKKTTSSKSFTVTAKSGLRVRSPPSTKSHKNILGAIPYGKTFVSTKQEDGWAYGTYKNLKGWACMKYLK